MYKDYQINTRTYNNATGWHITFVKTSCWHQNKSSVLVWGPCSTWHVLKRNLCCGVNERFWRTWCVTLYSAHQIVRLSNYVGYCFVRLFCKYSYASYLNNRLIWFCFQNYVTTNCTGIKIIKAEVWGQKKVDFPSSFFCSMWPKLGERAGPRLPEIPLPRCQREPGGRNL